MDVCDRILQVRCPEFVFAMRRQHPPHVRIQVTLVIPGYISAWTGPYNLTALYPVHVDLRHLPPALCPGQTPTSA